MVEAEGNGASAVVPSNRLPSQNPLVCHGHSRPIVDMHYSPVTKDGFFLISASKDGKPMLRYGDTGDWIGTFEGHKGAVWSACLNQTATLAATASADFTARLWDALKGEMVHEFQHKHIARTVSFSNDSARIVTGGMEKVMRIYDLTKPEADPVVLSKQNSGIRCAEWSMAEESLIYASCSDDPGVSVWDLRTNNIEQRWETKDVVTSIELSAEGTATLADGKEVTFWDIRGNKQIKKQTFPFLVESATLRSDKNRFVVAGSDMWVHVYDYESGLEVECNRGHHGPVHCVRFAPGGESYSSGSEDGTIRIWQTDPNKEVAKEEAKEEGNGNGKAEDGSGDKGEDAGKEKEVEGDTEE